MRFHETCGIVRFEIASTTSTDIAEMHAVAELALGLLLVQIAIVSVGNRIVAE